jgi:hypothetical protein
MGSALVTKSDNPPITDEVLRNHAINPRMVLVAIVYVTHIGECFVADQRFERWHGDAKCLGSEFR